MAANMTGPAMPTNMTDAALAATMIKTLSSDMTSIEMPGMCLVDNLNFATVFMILITAIANSRPKTTGRVAQFQAMDNTYDFIVVGGGSAGCVVANRYDADYAYRGHKRRSYGVIKKSVHLITVQKHAKIFLKVSF
jgi:hypothetical protein